MLYDFHHTLDCLQCGNVQNSVLIHMILMTESEIQLRYYVHTHLIYRYLKQVQSRPRLDSNAYTRYTNAIISLRVLNATMICR